MTSCSCSFQDQPDQRGFHRYVTFLLKHLCLVDICSVQIKPCHEIMALFLLHNLIVQTRMRSHPVGLDVWFLVGAFVYFHSSCVRTAKALARLRGCAGSPEPSLVAHMISTIISWAGSFHIKFKGCLVYFHKHFLHANSGDAGLTSRSVSYGQGLHCFPNIFLWDDRHRRINL